MLQMDKKCNCVTDLKIRFIPFFFDLDGTKVHLLLVTTNSSSFSDSRGISKSYCK